MYTIPLQKQPSNPFFFESVTIANLTHSTPASSRDEVFVSIQVNLVQSDNRKTTLRAKLDTGAQGNILPMRLYREMFPHQVDNNGKLKPKALLSSNVVLTAYGSSQIKHHTLHLREREHTRTLLRH